MHRRRQEKSVAKVPKRAESESVAEKAGTFKTASQKTEVSSRGARVARPRNFHQDRVQQLFAELIPLFSLMILSLDRVRQRLVVLIIMVTALLRDRVQQRLVEQIFVPRVSASDSLNASGVDEGAPMVMGAPSRTHGLSFILKPSAHERELAS